MRIAKRLKPCGTTAAYKRHHYNGETPCAECRAAAKLAAKRERAARSPNAGKHNSRKHYQSARNSHLWRKYGILPEVFEEIFQRQGKCCACCQSTEPNGGQWWCVDHDHTTGIIRGILCSKCNRGIGHLGDRLEDVIKAVVYLQRYKDHGGYKPDTLSPIKPRRKLQRKSRKHPRAPIKRFVKLEPHEPDQIRWLVSLGYQQKIISRFFSVSCSLVNLIVKNKLHATTGDRHALTTSIEPGTGLPGSMLPT